jgi:hypothetical protein
LKVLLRLQESKHGKWFKGWRLKGLIFVLVALMIILIFLSYQLMWPLFRHVSVVSDGDRHEPFEHGWMFRSTLGTASSIDMRPECIAEGLPLIPIGDDFRIIVRGQQTRGARYLLHKLVDDQWVRVLIVVPGRDERVYVPIDDEPGWWEQVDVESFFDALKPGEYILEIETSWGTSRSGWLGQYFIRFIL